MDRQLPPSLTLSFVSSQQEKHLREDAIYDAEKLAKTFRLDICRLYEHVADLCFEAGNHDRAAEFYEHSDVSLPKLVSRYAHLGMTEMVVSAFFSNWVVALQMDWNATIGACARPTISRSHGARRCNVLLVE